jgi:hypothetical protein
MSYRLPTCDYEKALKAEGLLKLSPPIPTALFASRLLPIASNGMKRSAEQPSKIFETPTLSTDLAGISPASTLSGR